jgi:hypothetical protein
VPAGSRWLRPKADTTGPRTSFSFHTPRGVPERSAIIVRRGGYGLSCTPPGCGGWGLPGGIGLRPQPPANFLHPSGVRGAQPSGGRGALQGRGAQPSGGRGAFRGARRAAIRGARFAALRAAAGLDPGGVAEISRWLCRRRRGGSRSARA